MPGKGTAVRRQGERPPVPARHPAGGAEAFCGVARTPDGSFDFTRPESRPPLRAGCACLRFTLPPALSARKAKGKGGRLQSAPLPPGLKKEERKAEAALPKLRGLDRRAAFLVKYSQ